MTCKVYRVEYDCENGDSIGMFLAEFHTSNEVVKNMCRRYRNKAPYMPEPEHPSFQSGIPYCIKFGCTSPEQLLSWFGYNKVLLKEVLSVFKLRVYMVGYYYDCDQQVGYDEDNIINMKELSYEDFKLLLKQGDSL